MDQLQFQQMSMAQNMQAGKIVYDGKRMRKAVVRRTVDYSSSVVKMLQTRPTNIIPPIQPQDEYVINFLPPSMYKSNPSNAATTAFVHASVNKVRTAIYCAKWTIQGKRIVTGGSSGEFTLWNGTTFNFETILQAHDTSVRSMTWSNNGNWMISGDHGGTIKFWQTSLNNLKIIEAHTEAVRDLSFSPTDAKFASCSDDGTIKIWDFKEAIEERTLSGHNWDVKKVDWHPQKSLLASGSKDNLIKLWDPKSGTNLCTIHSHKNTVFDVKWNRNGNWLLSCGKDQVVKVFDIRTMKEIQVFKGHQKDVTTLAWHPFHEGMFASGGSDGSIFFWQMDDPVPLAVIDRAHSSTIWDMDWHPMGHILASGGNDFATRFWTRKRPGKNVQVIENTVQESVESDFIPGMGANELNIDANQLRNDLIDRRDQRNDRFHSREGRNGDRRDDRPRHENRSRHDDGSRYEDRPRSDGRHNERQQYQSERGRRDERRDRR